MFMLHKQLFIYCVQSIEEDRSKPVKVFKASPAVFDQQQQHTLLLFPNLAFVIDSSWDLCITTTPGWHNTLQKKTILCAETENRVIITLHLKSCGENQNYHLLDVRNYVSLWKGHSFFHCIQNQILVPVTQLISRSFFLLPLWVTKKGNCSYIRWARGTWFLGGSSTSTSVDQGSTQLTGSLKLFNFRS